MSEERPGLAARFTAGVLLGCVIALALVSTAKVIALIIMA